MKQSPAQPDGLLAWMECLSDPTRLRLLRLLERRELGVQELCDVLQLPQSTVSRHLKVLSDREWLTNRREGTASLYRLDVASLDAGAKRLWTLARDQTDAWATVRQDRLRLDRLVQARRGEAETFFAGAAGQWDKLRGELYGSAFTREAMLALLPRHWTVADLGCGTAQLTRELSPHVAHVIGVDQSAAMLKAAGQRVHGLKNVTLRRGELEAIPIDDATCDAAMLVLVLTYIADPAAVLREAARILKPGGQVVVVDLLEHDREDFRVQMGQHWLGFTMDRLDGLLASGGFEGRRTRVLNPEPQARGPTLVMAVGHK